MTRILVVDDDPRVRRSIVRLLQRAGHEVIEAGGGREGYETFLAESADVVVTDLNMADGDGIEFINKLHQERASMPIVAVSGGGMFPKSLLLANAKLMGATVQLGKPFEASQLLAAIDQALAGQ